MHRSKKPARQPAFCRTAARDNACSKKYLTTQAFLPEEGFIYPGKAPYHAQFPIHKTAGVARVTTCSAMHGNHHLR
ncbi:hypothetical protein [Chitinolyticbacter meiyuanensis]|uniref:hypothetical protein n=1 Tax=Chitinolyticbacter meiyuanensis TaxID=682798 RepID=UPI0011E5C4F2|nr:hypothetical protein [Chitinolyticbacter meiyuanensis]